MQAQILSDADSLTGQDPAPGEGVPPCVTHGEQGEALDTEKSVRLYSRAARELLDSLFDRAGSRAVHVGQLRLLVVFQPSELGRASPEEVPAGHRVSWSGQRSCSRKDCKEAREKGVIRRGRSRGE